MNIFISDISAEQSAINLDDKRLVKMVLESAQILSTVADSVGESAPYKPTHKNHPAVKWAGASQSNFNWLVWHFHELCDEYVFRFDKDHASWKRLQENFYPQEICKKLPYSEACTAPPSSCGGSIEACREILRQKWLKDKRPPKWTKRAAPIWAKSK